MSLETSAMLTKLRYGTALLALVCLTHLPTTRSAMAVTVELARKCGALTERLILCACRAILQQVVNTEQQKRSETILTNAWPTEAI